MKIILNLTYAPVFVLMALLLTFKVARSEQGPMLLFDGVELVFSEDSNSLDMGKVKQGDVCSANITIKNQSEKVLRIANVRGSCALSVPSWPRRDIAPGEEGVILVRYDASRPGVFHRNVTIHANTRTSVTVLKVTGEIIPD